jgi:hypothetical protein
MRETARCVHAPINRRVDADQLAILSILRKPSIRADEEATALAEASILGLRLPRHSLSENALRRRAASVC